MDLVIALYEGAIESTRQANQYFHSGDVWARSRAVSKAHKILTELLISVDLDKGGAVSQNLRKLYIYMQRRLLEAHAKQSPEAFAEVERLLSSLLDAWRVVAANTRRAEAATFVSQDREMEGFQSAPYRGYLYEPMDTFSRP